MLTSKLGEHPGDLPEQRRQALAVVLAPPGTDQITIVSMVAPPDRATTRIAGRVAIRLLPLKRAGESAT